MQPKRNRINIVNENMDRYINVNCESALFLKEQKISYMIFESVKYNVYFSFICRNNSYAKIIKDELDFMLLSYALHSALK